MTLTVPALLERLSPAAQEQFKAEVWRAAQQQRGLYDWATRYPPTLRTPHPAQVAFLTSTAKRKVIRAGRRGGKTTGIAIAAIQAFTAGLRVLYATPTQEQVDAFWFEVKTALQAAIEAKALYKNESTHIVEVPGTKARIRAKTAWDADSLRGDYGDLLIFDEYQLMNEDAWGRVGAPMLLDNDGDAVFIYTPPSLHSRSRTKARDPRHAAKLYKRAEGDTSGRWQTFHFSSHDNPHISEDALAEITGDMTATAYDQEILALDKDEAPGALWQHDALDALRVDELTATAVRVVVGVDPPGGATECGIVVAALGSDGQYYTLDDYSLQGSPATWGAAVVSAYEDYRADVVAAEKNFGGDMVESNLRSVEGGKGINLKLVTASRGKAVRAEPIAARYERGMVHHVGNFPHLEDELCNWEPNTGQPSPNRLDALVWALTELSQDRQPGAQTVPSENLYTSRRPEAQRNGHTGRTGTRRGPAVAALYRSKR